ncbi:MAG TPA: class I SAM-dependent methyltransferase [Myxococcota bacterium]|nr:class I SAM-dependent methyltransferase [Myxococcota bacterium]
MIETMSPERIAEHATMLANRVRKRYRALHKQFARANIDVFRLYDWDIPEVRAVVDWYAGHLVVAEYTRQQTGPDWLPTVAKAAAKALGIPDEKLFLKERRTGVSDGPRYQRFGHADTRFVVNEGDLQFWVNLSDRIDTGLFSDHRNTRQLMRSLAAGKEFLNLYAYTGAFTCAVALGEAARTVTVDRSATYCAWTVENLKLNGLYGPQHEVVQMDSIRFLEAAARQKQSWDLVFVDPPSFSKDRGPGPGFDILQDHPQLLAKVLAVTKPGGTVIFSTNHQRFEPRFDGLPIDDLSELTPDSIPLDYRNKGVHRCWRMVHKSQT